MSSQPLFSPEQFKEIIGLMQDKQSKEPVSVKHDFVDNLSKIGVALCTAAILYVATQLQGLTTDVAVMKTQMIGFAKFAEEPRFTEEKNQAADQRLVSQVRDLIEGIAEGAKDNSNKINSITRELDRRSVFMESEKDFNNEVEKRIHELEKRIQNIESKDGA